VDLAREGWIGCDQRGYALISDVIKAGTEAGRSAMLAVIEGSGAKTSFERRKRVAATAPTPIGCRCCRRI